ncbi:trypsin-like peptidase domain-containing protein [Streptomyces sp. NPDC057486]|uniref:trypsin-like peptidase domain-containing protein n=1 Tax=Streptomyces sp. NPDC057486 TaxID=3346145 RepID=UPI00369D10AB
MGSGDRSTLVRICDPTGRPRGTGFVADDRGTVVTSHEAVDGVARLVLYGKGDRRRSVGAEAITALPELDLALVRTGGLDVLGVEPLRIVLQDRIDPGTYVRTAAHGWRQARVLGMVPVTYGAAGRSHRVGAALELALGTDGSDALRQRGAAIGGPVLDPQTGAVIAVLCTDLTASQAEQARARYALPSDALAPGHDRHPLTLRLLAEVRKALPADVPGQPDSEDVFGAHLDLMCLRIAVRIAAASRPALRGTAVRRPAAQVAGRVHEAARRCLGPGQGELDRAAFEEVFPWCTGWATAVLAEGLLVPAGAGYRFAHEELGDRVQGAHLDLDAALRALVHRWHVDEPGRQVRVAQERVPAPRSQQPGSRRTLPGAEPTAPVASREPRTLPVPRHRIGPVIQALLLLGRRQGSAALAHRLADLIEAMDRLSTRTDGGAGGRAPAGGAERTGPPRDASWWAAHLLAALLRVPDARPYLGVARLLTGRIVRRAGALGAYGEFGPWFWLRLRLEQGAHRDPIVLDALLCAAAHGSDRRAPVRTRALVHRTGMLLVRTAEGAARFDRRLVELARDVPGFAELVTGWLADAPQEWAAVVGPGARRTVEAVSTAMPMPMQAAGRGHGSLRPA